LISIRHYAIIILNITLSPLPTAPLFAAAYYFAISLRHYYLLIISLDYGLHPAFDAIDIRCRDICHYYAIFAAIAIFADSQHYELAAIDTLRH
jgi:hypothetical protein